MKPYRLVSREAHPESTIVEIDGPSGPVKIGEGTLTVIAGPCAVESEEGYLISARAAKEAGAHMLRGGVFKPRTSPYSFQGLGEAGLRILTAARRETGLPVVTEVLDVRDLDRVAAAADMIQVGSRNMQNFSLLSEIGKTTLPVLLKRGLANTVEEWFLAAEYILTAGNSRVVLCERGIRTFENLTRNTLDIGVVPLVKDLSHLPLIVDPSHATGHWRLVRPVARAAVVAGADGVMIEIHHSPEQALSDGKQSLNPAGFMRLMDDIRVLAGVEGKRI